ncbi:uncharacterized protein TrAFT101_010381 [Trichoderma asperellum]|uniref:uncharacterized protein n=1 Tax=Trichoderma asperellum TaxID=101201 RepID=UPI00332C16EA|nr:hypothetical protein TrAFT101_010381 [Trichoderma asperellum]
MNGKNKRLRKFPLSPVQGSRNKASVEIRADESLPQFMEHTFSPGIYGVCCSPAAQDRAARVTRNMS